MAYVMTNEEVAAGLRVCVGARLFRSGVRQADILAGEIVGEIQEILDARVRPPTLDGAIVDIAKGPPAKSDGGLIVRDDLTSTARVVTQKPDGAEQPRCWDDLAGCASGRHSELLADGWTFHRPDGAKFPLSHGYYRKEGRVFAGSGPVAVVCEVPAVLFSSAFEGLARLGELEFARAVAKAEGRYEGSDLFPVWLSVSAGEIENTVSDRLGGAE